MPFKDRTSPRSRFSQHKQNARRRKMDFTLTFSQWWELWEPYWKEKEHYSMARNGDTGGYTLGNVQIKSKVENLAERMPNGAILKGDSVPNAKLVTTDITRIFDMIRAGVAKQAIADYFGVSRRAIRNIADGKAWRSANG